MTDNVKFLMKMGYTFHQAVALENWRLWNQLEREREAARKAYDAGLGASEWAAFLEGGG